MAAFTSLLMRAAAVANHLSAHRLPWRPCCCVQPCTPTQLRLCAASHCLQAPASNPPVEDVWQGVFAWLAVPHTENHTFLFTSGPLPDGLAAAEAAAVANGMPPPSVVSSVGGLTLQPARKNLLA